MTITSALESVIFQRNSFEFSSDSTIALLKSPSVVIRINVYVSHQRGLAEIPLFCFIRTITECESVWVNRIAGVFVREFEIGREADSSSWRRHLTRGMP